MGKANGLRLRYLLFYNNKILKYNAPLFNLILKYNSVIIKYYNTLTKPLK